MTRSEVFLGLTVLLSIVFPARICLAQNKVLWTRKITAGQDICAFCISPGKKVDSIAVLNPWGQTYVISQNDFRDNYLLVDTFKSRGSEENYAALVRGGEPDFSSDTDDQVAWEDALSTYKKIGVAPLFRLGRNYFKGSRLVVSAEDSALTLLSEPTEGSFFRIAYQYNMNKDGFFDVPIGNKPVRCRIDFQSEYDFTIPSRLRDHFSKSAFVEILPGCFHVNTLRFGEFDIARVVVKVVEDTDCVTLGFSLIRRLNCVLDFNDKPKLLIAAEKPVAKIDYLHRHDIELVTNTHGAEIVTVSRNGLLFKVVKKGDCVVAINGRSVAGEYNFSIKERLAQAAIKGGCLRLVRNDQELDIDITPNPQRLRERESIWEGNDQ